MYYEDDVVLCVSNAYEKKFYMNPDFNGLPDHIKKELKIMLRYFFLMRMCKTVFEVCRHGIMRADVWCRMWIFKISDFAGT